MTPLGWLLIIIFAGLTGLMVKPLGGYIAAVFTGRSAPLRPLGPLERGLYRLAGVDPAAEQGWLAYAMALLAFHLAGILLLYALQRLQGLLPLNPGGFDGVAPILALNTAISFVSNTSWQSYGGETTLSYLVQMAGITVQSFLSAASGMAVAMALVRGLARHGGATIGNFWADMTRATLYVLLPVAIVAALLLIWQGVPQTLGGAVEASTPEGVQQLISLGPVASQEVIKLMGGDGGGFFNVNSAHPFENPTAFSNLVEMLLIFVIGAALTNSFGRMVGDARQGWVLLGAMAAMFAAGLVIIYAAESHGNPNFAALHIDQAAGAAQGGGNMEGKEVRFGIAGSSLFANVGTTSSDGAVDGMLDSYNPISGFVLMANMMVDEVIIGAPGSGLFSMLLFAILAVFVAGLMVGRTPEYLGNKIHAAEVKMTMLALLAAPACILVLTAIAAVLPVGLSQLGNHGPHGFSELLYAYTSAATTNGSAFAGLGANTPFFNLTLALAMFIGRFLVIVPVLAVAGSLATKRLVPASAGTLPTNSLQFAGLLVGIVLIVGGLTFFPALALGPLAEHFSYLAGTVF